MGETANVQVSSIPPFHFDWSHCFASANLTIVNGSSLAITNNYSHPPTNRDKLPAPTFFDWSPTSTGSAETVAARLHRGG